MASNVSSPTNLRADRVITAVDVVAALLQPARDLDGLIRADSAGDAESDKWHFDG